MTGEHIDDTTLEAALRASELDRGEDATLRRVQSRVRGHVRESNAGGTGWSRGQRLAAFAAIAVPATAAAAIAAIVVLGHGPTANKIVQPAGSPVPIVSASPTALPVTAQAHCATSDLQVAATEASGAAGTIEEVFEVRNSSQAACLLNGYFGVAAVDASGHVFASATRSTDIPFGTSNPPHDILLPAGSAPLAVGTRTPGQGVPAPVAGHAYFYVSYGHNCNGGAPSGADRWQLYPPDQTSVIIVQSQERTFCDPVVTPADDTDILKPH